MSKCDFRRKTNVVDDYQQLAFLACIVLTTMKKGGVPGREDGIGTVKGTYCKSMQYPVADASQSQRSLALFPFVAANEYSNE